MRLPHLIVAGSLAACSPPLDWREVRPHGTGALLLFPCKPAEDARKVSLAGIDVEMTLLACEADGATWALAHADLGDPARVARALGELTDAAARNIAASRAASAPAAIPGMTPNPRASRLRAEGTRPNGAAIYSDTTVFARGTRVYQATVLSTAPHDAATAKFAASIRWP
jgi:hypothetical protein